MDWHLGIRRVQETSSQASVQKEAWLSARPRVFCATLLYISARSLSTNRPCPCRFGVGEVGVRVFPGQMDDQVPRGQSRVQTHGMTCYQQVHTIRIGYASGSGPSPPSIPCLKLIAASELFLLLGLLS